MLQPRQGIADKYFNYIKQLLKLCTKFWLYVYFYKEISAVTKQFNKRTLVNV